MVISLDNGTKVTIEVENARTLKVFPQEAIEHWESKNIKELSYSSDFKIAINNPIIVNDNPFLIQVIDKYNSGSKSSSGYYLRTHKLTKTSQFIVPLLGFDRKSLLWDSLFCNAFIGVENDNYGEFLYLLYRYGDSGEEIANLDDMLTSSDFFVESIDTDEYHVLYKLKTPLRSKKDIELILKGKYSQISQESKLCILHFFQGNRDTPMGQILYKSTKRKQIVEEQIGESLPVEAELLSAPLKENEIFSSKYIIV